MLDSLGTICHGWDVVIFVKATNKDLLLSSVCIDVALSPTGGYLVPGDHGDRDGRWRTPLLQ